MDSSLERGLALLTEIAASGEHTAASLALAVGLPVSTTYRYLRVLRDGQFVREHRGRYEAGTALVGLSGRHSAQSYLAEVGPAVLAALVEEIGETAVMIVRVGTRALCLRRAEPDKSLKYTFAINQLLPLHAGAGQRTLLAWAPDAVIKQVLGRELERFTDRTPTAEQLRQSIPTIRRVGWALSRGEFDAGAVSVAVPVLFGGEAVCSLNVAGPEARCGSREWVKNTVQVLHSAAADLTDALGVWAPASQVGLQAPREQSSVQNKEIA
ncbi:IclR family transcriptional regulator [Homoserinimonas sp. A447]